MKRFKTSTLHFKFENMFCFTNIDEKNGKYLIKIFKCCKYRMCINQIRKRMKLRKRKNKKRLKEKN